MSERDCQCDVCKLSKKIQGDNLGHYLCKSATSLTTNSESALTLQELVKDILPKIFEKIDVESNLVDPNWDLIERLKHTYLVIKPMVEESERKSN